LADQTKNTGDIGGKLGTAKDVARMKDLKVYGLKTEFLPTEYQRKLDTDLIKYNNEYGTSFNVRNPNPTEADKFTGYTDVPGFNQELNYLKAKAQYGKRPLETKIGSTDAQKVLVRAEDIPYIGNDMPNVTYGQYLNTDFMPGKVKKYTAKEAFQQLTPNKYGGQQRGWLDELDELDEEYRRGGQRRRRGTSKNIQSSINDVFERNYDVFGPAGKLRFNPRSRYEEGGWLNQYQEAGQLRTASTTAAVPVSTQAPINPVNPESTMGMVDFVKHRWNTRDERPSDWNMMMMDKTGSYVDSGVDPFTLMLSAPQQVIKTATALKTIKSGTPKSLKVSQAPRKSYQDLTIRDKVINPSKPITSIPEEFQPYISRTNPDFFKLYDKNLSKAEMKKKMLENTTFFDRKGNVISTPENLKKTGGQSGWLDKYNNF
jgi:hypothetical protein